MNNGSLRRAAILIASLDTESADALLDEMTPDQAARVRNAVMELGDIDIVEQQEVIEQFVGRNSTATPPSDAGIELDPDLERKFGAVSADQSAAANGSEPSVVSPSPQPADPTPFAFLVHVEPDEIALALANEHPQTVAIVMAHLQPAQAAKVLEHLPRNRKTDVLMRIARMRPPHPDVLRDLEREIQSLLAHRQQPAEMATAGLAAVEAILQSTNASARQNLVADLMLHDQTLVDKLRSTSPHHTSTHTVANPASQPSQQNNDESNGAHWDTHTAMDAPPATASFATTQTTLEFSDLERLDQTALALVLQRGDTQTTLLALAGASRDFVRQIMAHLPKREAEQLDRRIQDIRPLRLLDIQHAQQRLARIAQQLMDEGKITVPEKQRLSVAA